MRDESAKDNDPSHVHQHTGTHRGVQGLDAPVEQLGESRVLRDVGHSEAGVTNGLGRAASREQLDASISKNLGEVDEASLITDGEERGLDFNAAERKSVSRGNRDAGLCTHRSTCDPFTAVMVCAMVAKAREAARSITGRRSWATLAKCANGRAP